MPTPIEEPEIDFAGFVPTAGGITARAEQYLAEQRSEAGEALPVVPHTCAPAVPQELRPLADAVTELIAGWPGADRWRRHDLWRAVRRADDALGITLLPTVGTGDAWTTLAEADLQQRVIDLAQLRGWRVAHIRPARTADGWRTPYTGHAGLPDLILARNGHVLLAELKSAVGRPTSDQSAWLAAASEHGRLWRPVDWPTIATELM